MKLWVKFWRCWDCHWVSAFLSAIYLLGKGFGASGGMVVSFDLLWRFFECSKWMFFGMSTRIRTNIPKKKLGTPTHQPFASEFQSAYLTWRPTHHPPIGFGGHAHRRFRVRRPFLASFCPVLCRDHYLPPISVGCKCWHFGRDFPKMYCLGWCHTMTPVGIRTINNKAS